MTTSTASHSTQHRDGEPELPTPAVKHARQPPDMPRRLFFLTMGAAAVSTAFKANISADALLTERTQYRVTTPDNEANRTAAARFPGKTWYLLGGFRVSYRDTGRKLAALQPVMNGLLQNGKNILHQPSTGQLGVLRLNDHSGLHEVRHVISGSQRRYSISLEGHSLYHAGMFQPSQRFPYRSGRYLQLSGGTVYAHRGPRQQPSIHESFQDLLINVVGQYLAADWVRPLQ